ncbi:cyclic nucleotide-binding domain-containing protein [Halomonadaceae bacterium KBTZ08]
MPDQSRYQDAVIDMLVVCPLFDRFAPQELQYAAPYFHLENIPQGGEVFREGDAGTFMGVVHEGKVAVLKADSDNQPVRVAMLQRGKIFGEMAVIDGERRSASCVAETPCTLLTLSKDSLDKMVEAHPKIAARVIRALAMSLSRRLRMVDFQLADHQL